MTRFEKKQVIIVKQFAEQQAKKGYHIWHPATDLFETRDDFRVMLEIGGMKSEDFSISYYKNILSIVGFRSGEEKEGSYHRMEIPFGDFSSSIKFPREVMINSIEAFYENGFLTVILPKKKSIRIDLSKD